MPGRRTFSALVVVGLLLATAAAALLAYESERDEAREADEARARQIALAAQQEVTGLVGSLRGADALVSAGGDVDPGRFDEFASEVLRGTPFSGLALSVPVAPEDREEFEEELGRPIAALDSEGGLEPVRASADRLFLPIALVHPDDPQRRRQLLGFDLFSDPVRAQVTRDAIDAREPRISRPIELADPERPGAVVFDPITHEDGSLAGVLSTGVEGTALAAAVSRQLDLDQQDVTLTDRGEVLSGSGQSDPDAQADVAVLGMRWTASVSGAGDTNVTPAIAYGAGGLALTLAAGGLLVIAARRERDLVDRQKDAERLIARETLHVRITEAIEHEIEGDARLGSVARQMVPAVGDICVIHEATADGNVRRVGVAAPDERTTELIRSLPEPPATSPIRAAISSRQPVLYTRISEDREARRARARGIPPRPGSREADPTAMERLEGDQLSSMIVPLVARDRVLGTISLTVLRSTGRPPLSREDLAFAMEVATHAAVAVDNARLYEQQRDIAGVLQSALVPRELIEVPGAEVAARHRAGMAGTEVGGDFYDLFEVGGHWMAVIGDVCGKGPEAAALTALARHTVRATARLGPAGAVARVHEAIRDSGEHTYVTLCCAELRPSFAGIEASITTAGHPEPWLIGADGKQRRLDVTGPLVGILDSPTFTAQEVRLEPGDLLFMCSDGLPEARHNGEFFGEHRLGALLAGLASAPPEAMLERLEREILRFVEGSPRDDLAMFALRVS
jgi:CHASE1-domain containing sensor protein/GAF domain-containing protein